jgi:cell division protein FtsW (lipid II flippase)
MKLNPLILICFYIGLHIVITVILMATIFSGQGSFEFVVNAIRYLFYGILSLTIVSAIIYRTWSKENWIILSIFIVVSMAVIFSRFGLTKGD